MHNDRPTDLTFLIDPFPDSPASGRVTWAEVEALAAVAPPDKNAARAAAAGRGPHARRPGTRSLASHTDKRIRAYMATVGPAVSNSGGHNKAFETAQALVNGWCLSVPDAMPYYEDWNHTCVPPWSDAELRHKLQDAQAKPCDKPRGWLLDAPGRDDSSATGATAGQSSTGPTAPGSPEADPPDLPGVEALEPRHLAETFLARRYRVAGDAIDYRLAHYAGRYLAWTDGAYRELADDRLANAMTAHAEAEAHREHVAKLDDYEYARKNGGDGAKLPKAPVRARVTRTTAADALAAVRCRIEVPAASAAPCWLTPRGGRPDPAKLIATTRGVIDPDSADPTVPAPTPELFVLAASPHYDPDAVAPVLWLKFLAQVLGDADSIGTLQEFAGLLLTPDTSHQKFLFLMGRIRGGKGTIIKVLTLLVGEEFTEATDLNTLSNDHGAGNLVGKTLATMGDVRIGTRTDVTVGLQRLLSITGEDSIPINQKNRPVFTTRLRTRFVVASNELPNIQDSANALAARALVLRFNHTFTGKEDTKLIAKLRGELPGIFAWALTGLRRLNERGHFVQPEAGGKTLGELRDALSPITRFVRERCIVDPFASVQKMELFYEYERWCKAERIGGAGPAHVFGGKLKDIVENLREEQLRVSCKRHRFYGGIRLRDDTDTEDCTDGSCGVGTPGESGTSDTPLPSSRPPGKN